MFLVYIARICFISKGYYLATGITLFPHAIILICCYLSLLLLKNDWPNDICQCLTRAMIKQVWKYLLTFKYFAYLPHPQLLQQFSQRENLIEKNCVTWLYCFSYSFYNEITFKQKSWKPERLFYISYLLVGPSCWMHFMHFKIEYFS